MSSLALNVFVRAFKNIYLLLFYSHKCLGLMTVCALHICLVPAGHKRHNSLEFGFQVIEIYHVGAGNCTQVFSKSGKCSWFLRHLSRSAITGISKLPPCFLQRKRRCTENGDLNQSRPLYLITASSFLPFFELSLQFVDIQSSLIV